MRSGNRVCSALLVAVVGTVLGGPWIGSPGAAGSAGEAAVLKEILPNGMRVLLLPSHNAPIIGSVIVVEAGSAYESPALSGASHFLEHLLFNGTESMSQEELYDATDLIGGYNNATTGRLQTTFMMVAPSENLADALRIQADMLFRSVLPADKLEKERGIILEELEKDRTSESYDVERIVREILYHDSAYGLPVLGTTLTIQTLTRQQIWDYYKSRYIPQAMTVLLVGDFDPESALGDLEEILGSQPPSAVNPPPPPLPPEIRTNEVQRFVRPLSRGYLTAVLPAPSVHEPQRLAMEAAVDLLAGDEASPLGSALEGRLPGAILSYGASLTEEPGLGRLQVSVTYDPSVSGEAVLDALLASFRGLRLESLGSGALEEWKTAERAREYFDRENPHYYGVLRAAACALEGPWALASRPQRVRDLQWAQVRAAAANITTEPRWAVIVDPRGEEDDESAEEPAGTRVHRAVFDNGAKVVVLESPDSPVLAIYHLTLGRSVLETEKAQGLTEIVHRMLGEGVAGEDATSLQRRLRRIGAELKTADLDWIPYDDYQTTPDYSYIHLQCLDEHGEEAFRLLGDLLNDPTFSEGAFEKGKAALLAKARRNLKSPKERAYAILRKTLYGGSPAALNPFGTAATLDSVTFDDARELWDELSRPEGTLVAVATGRDSETIFDWIREGMYPGSALETIPPDAPAGTALRDFWTSAGDTVEKRFDGLLEPASNPSSLPWPSLARQAGPRTRFRVDSLGAGRGHVLVASLIDNVGEDRRSHWIAWNAWVSDRLAFRLREEMGMAYGIGSSLVWLGPGRALWIASASTRPQNLEAMTEGLLEGPRLGRLRPPTTKDIEKAVAGTYGRQLMRRSTRLKRCYYAALSLLNGRDVFWDEQQLQQLNEVDPEEVRQLARDVARMDLPTLVVIVR